jgi:hypothetical protein
MEIVEIECAGRTAVDCEEAIKSQFWRFDQDLVIRFSLTGGTKKGDYPDIDFDGLRSAMPHVLECQFAIKTRQRWILR